MKNRSESYDIDANSSHYYGIAKAIPYVHGTNSNAIKKRIGLIVILCIMFAGCIGSPPKMDNPLSSAPGMIMDYDENINMTRIWVKGEATDYKYSRITIIIDETDKVEDNNTYFLSHSTNLDIFSLRIIVWTENTYYGYVCNVTRHEFGTEDENNPRFTIIDDKKETVVFEKHLPFKRMLEEVKE